MTITFVGHSVVPSTSELKNIVKEHLRSNIINADTVVCYVGGYGDFDKICACACRELKNDFFNLEVVYVTPYINLSAQLKIKEMKNLGLCDSSVYPPIENVPPKFAISKRNEWMITNADLVLAYVNRNYGGAYQSLRMAKRKKKKIINLFDYVNRP